MNKRPINQIRKLETDLFIKKSTTPPFRMTRSHFPIKRIALTLLIVLSILSISGCVDRTPNTPVQECELFPVSRGDADTGLFQGCRDKHGIHITSDELTVPRWAKQKWYGCREDLCFEEGNLWKCVLEEQKMVLVDGVAECQSYYICSYNAYNCDYFKTHAEAQKVYEECGGVSDDVHKLDRDKDGSACETLP